MKNPRLSSLVVVGLLAVGSAVHAVPSPKTCREALAKSAGKYFDARYKARSRCESAQAKTGVPADCIADPAVAAALTRASDRLGHAIDSRCTGYIPTLDLEFGCKGVADTAGLVDCIVNDVHGFRAEELLAAAYGTTGMIADGLLRNCQSTIAKALATDASMRQKTRRNCAKRLFPNETSCPDDKATRRMAASRDKLIARVEAKCTDAQVVDAAINFGGLCGDPRPTAPASPFNVMTFDRVGVTATNAVPSRTRLSRCLASASGVDGDTSIGAIYPILRDTDGFDYGVAAGDATPTGFVAWTRSQTAAPITLNVSTDPTFATVDVVVPGLSANPARDYTVKVDVGGLTASTQYYYQFTQGGFASRVGRIRTAPAPASTAPITFAFSGDANAFYKPYNVLEGVVADDPDVFLFFGDTIYGDDPRSGTGVATVLADYYVKYKENRDDLAMRNQFGNIGNLNMWDDHEVSNDFYGSPFGAFGPQIIAGNQAFRDYMPMREDGGDPMKLYRSVKWGNVAEFFLTDDRQYRSAQAYVTEPACLSAGNPAVLPSPACNVEINDPTRTYLGAAQKAWLKAGLAASTAKWKFIINGPVFSSLVFLPYDRPEGYGAERTELLEFIRNPDGNVMTDDHLKNVVILSTDIHAGILNTVANPGPSGGGVTEVVAGAIGMDSIYRELPPSVLSLAASLPTLFPSVKFYEIDRRNYVHVAASTTSATFTYKDNVGSPLKTFTLTAE